MPLYAYAYVDELGYTMTGEVGAGSLEAAAEEVRRSLGRVRAFVLWDRDDPPPRIRAWMEKFLKDH